MIQAVVTNHAATADTPHAIHQAHGIRATHAAKVHIQAHTETRVHHTFVAISRLLSFISKNQIH